MVTCIGVLDYYPDPVPVLRLLGSYLNPRGLLVITFPNALSPCGWLYMLASQFTVPITPRSPAFAKRTAHQAGFSIESMRYAFPAVPLVGYTIVLALSK